MPTIFYLYLPATPLTSYSLPNAMAKTFSKDDVASHGKGDSLWIVIDEDVYDVSKFQDEHPGMSEVMRHPA